MNFRIPDQILRFLCCAFMALTLLTQAASASAQSPALVDGYHLKPASAVVKAGGTVKLDLVYCRVKSDQPGAKPKASGKPGKKYIEDDLAPLGPPDPNSKPKRKSVQDDLAPLPVLELVCEGDEGYGEALAPLVSPADVTWKIVDGPGRVSGDRKGATYHAPASRPKPNTATVSAAITYNVGKEKTILFSKITILDEVRTYIGTFTLNDVGVNNEYTRKLAGNIRWEFDEYYEDGQWREYVGKGTASMSIDRVGCGGAVSFTNVPVEGWLKVHDDKKYEFQLSLVSDQEQKRTCHRPDLDKKLKWEETFSPAGDAVISGDPCGEKEFYPRYTDILTLSSGRNGSCRNNVTNRFQDGWSFKAVE
jgi:hypothetical protein